MVEAISKWIKEVVAGHYLVMVDRRLEGNRLLLEVEEQLAEIPQDSTVLDLFNAEQPVILPNGEKASPLGNDLWSFQGQEVSGQEAHDQVTNLLRELREPLWAKRREIKSDWLGQSSRMLLPSRDDPRQLIKRTITSLTLFRRQLLSDGGKPKLRKVRVQATFPVDLKGWKYLRDIPNWDDFWLKIRQSNLDEIRVHLAFKRRQLDEGATRDLEWAGYWDDKRYILAVAAKVGSTTESDYEAGLAKMAEILRHELAHVGQTILQVGKGLPELGGLPGKSLRETGADPEGRRLKRKDYIRHELRDVEFYTNLLSAFDDFRYRYRGSPPDRALSQATSFAKSTFADLIRANPRKGGKAVAEFLKAIESWVNDGMPKFKLADLTPPLGYPGGPCYVVQRIDQEIREPRLKDHLIDEVESGHSLTNPEAAKVYDLEAEPGVGIAKRILIGPHAQYRMDLRQITVPQIRATLKTYSKLLNDWKSQKSPKYQAWARGEKILFTEPRLGLTIVFAPAGRDTLKLITTYWEGEPDPKPPGVGCEVVSSMTLRVAARWLNSALFQPPPEMLKALRKWAFEVFAGHVWAMAELALVVELGRANLFREVKAEVSVLRRGLLRRLNTIEAKTIGGEFTVEFGKKLKGTAKAHQLEIHVWKYGEAQVQWGVQARSPSLGLDEWRVDTKDQVIDQINEALDRYEKRLDEAIEGERRYQKQLSPSDKGSVVELTRLIRECKQYASSPKRYKTKAEADLKVDVRGWKYLAGLNLGEIEEHLAKTGWSKITVVLNFKRHKRRAGQWSRLERKLEVDIPSRSAMSVVLFRDVLDRIDETIVHELGHVGQDVLPYAKKQELGAGLPSKDLRAPGYTPSGLPAKGRGQRLEHSLRDVEFYTNLGDAIRMFKRELPRIPIPARESAARQFVGLPSKPYRHPTDPRKDNLIFFQTPELSFKNLKDKAPEKWEKAVKEFWKAVGPLIGH